MKNIIPHYGKTAAAPVQSVCRAMGMLSAVALGGRPLPLSELARGAGLRANTARNLLKSLIACGYLAQDEDARYVPGRTCRQIGLANRLQSRQDAVQACLEQVSRRLGEAVVLTTLAAGRRQVVCRADPQQLVRVDSEAMGHEDIFGVVTGRVLTAHASDEELAEVLAVRGLPGSAWEGIASLPRLRVALAKVRAASCLTMSERSKSLVSAACAVLDREGRLLAAVGAYAPAYRCPASKMRRVVSELKCAAGKLSPLLS